MAEKALVLSADPWEMTDKDTGQVVSGVSFWYVNQYREGENGQKPTKVSATAEIFEKVKGKLPAICEMEYGSRPGAGGKAALAVVGANILRTVDLTSFFNGPAPKGAA